MDFRKFSQKYAQEVGGQFREYDDARSVIIIPIGEGRFQTVIGHVTHNEDYQRDVIQIKSKVCELKEDIPYEDLLEASMDFPYTKFIVEDEFLKVEATTFLVNLTEDMIKEMILEVANISDDWEFRITGKDIH